MRAGAYTVQQTLTSEAASVLKLSLSLARRRGHAQVTPLHVAATLLTSRASLLKRACLKSHPHPSSHPLQCRALELCFNVALNRLPTNTGPLLHSQPSLSNALIAALKRAQAHQRRGCIEQQQQQPLLAIKVELEQLIISILDDPSVSRVMREAGFSSTCVKNNMEDTVSSVFQCYSSCSPSPGDIQTSFWQTHFLNSSAEQNPLVFPNQKRHFSAHFIDSGTENKEDLRLILEVMLRKKRRNTVVVGDGFSSTEGLVLELMGKVERGEVPEELRSVQFVKFQLCPVSLKFMKREDVEMKVAELRRKVGSHALEGGAVIYAGDLKWAVEEAHVRGGIVGGGGVPGYYSPVEHLIAEVGRLLSDFSSCSNSKVWLMAVANYQTYMKCQMKTPPLEMQWALQAVAVPSGGLALSLHASSGLDARGSLSHNPSQLVESKLFNAKEEQDKLICCPECTSNFEKEAGIFKSSQQKPGDANDTDKGSNHLPYWLQQHRQENHHKKDIFLELRRKWNRLCQSLHHPHNQIQMNPSLFNQSGSKSYTYSTSYPWWPTSLQYKQNVFTDLNSISFAESASKPGTNSNYMAQLKDQQSWSVELGVGNGTHKHHPSELSLDSLKKSDKELKITLALGNPLFSDSITSKDQMRGTKDLGGLCRELQENIYWQSETISAIAAALHDHELRVKNGTWLLMQGTDWIGKRRLALAIAASRYGSVDRLVHMNLRRIRENKSASCAEILSEALRSDANRVVLIEEIDWADTHFINFLATGYENGKFEDPIGRKMCSSNTVIIMTTGSSMMFDEDIGKNPNSVIQMKLQLEEIATDTIESSDYKRKAEWDLSNNAKRLRTGEKEDPLIIEECEIETKQFSRQSSATSLDLNICADDDEADGEESNAVLSDLTQETPTDLHTPNGFLESIRNRFVFDRNPARIDHQLEKFLSKLKWSFQEALGRERRWCLCIDGVVLEELVEASATFLDNLFEKWLKDVFQTSLLTVGKGGKEAVVRLSLEGKDGNVETSFHGSSLPKNIQVD